MTDRHAYIGHLAVNGGGRTAAHSLRKLRSAIHKVRIERYYVLDTEPHRVQARIPVEFRCIRKPEDGLNEKLSMLNGKNINWQRRFDLDHQCVLACHNGQLVGSIWIAPACWVVGNEEPAGDLAPDVAFVYDGFTAESMRGQRVASARLCYIHDEMRRQGFRRNLTTVEDDNIPSIRSVLTVGYRKTDNLVQLHRRFMIFRSIKGGPPPDVLPNAAHQTERREGNP